MKKSPTLVLVLQVVASCGMQNDDLSLSCPDNVVVDDAGFVARGANGDVFVGTIKEEGDKAVAVKLGQHGNDDRLSAEATILTQLKVNAPFNMLVSDEICEITNNFQATIKTGKTGSGYESREYSAGRLAIVMPRLPQATVSCATAIKIAGKELVYNPDTGTVKINGQRDRSPGSKLFVDDCQHFIPRWHTFIETSTNVFIAVLKSGYVDTDRRVNGAIDWDKNCKLTKEAKDHNVQCEASINHKQRLQIIPRHFDWDAAHAIESYATKEAFADGVRTMWANMVGNAARKMDAQMAYQLIQNSPVATELQKVPESMDPVHTLECQLLVDHYTKQQSFSVYQYFESGSRFKLKLRLDEEFKNNPEFYARVLAKVGQEDLAQWLIDEIAKDLERAKQCMIEKSKKGGTSQHHLWWDDDTETKKSFM